MTVSLKQSNRQTSTPQGNSTRSRPEKNKNGVRPIGDDDSGGCLRRLSTPEAVSFVLLLLSSIARPSIPKFSTSSQNNNVSRRSFLDRPPPLSPSTCSPCSSQTESMHSLEMQPGAGIAIPERGSSLPPLHLHSSEPLHDISSSSCLPAVMMKQRKLENFPWTRLPSDIQQRILSYAILPDGPGTPLIIGDPGHSTHLREVAVPVLLALGSWSAYFDGVRVLYRAVYLDICARRRSSLTFLTSHHAFRPRSMVVKLRMTLDIKKSLPLFDTGHTIRQSKGKLIKMNVPTALRCMKVHGRLSEVGFLIDSLAAAGEAEDEVPEYYLPLAEIQLVNQGVLQASDNHVAAPSLGMRSDIKQAETVIAPAFLACRAWQSGFLPLFEHGTFKKGVSLGLVLNGQHPDHKRTSEEGDGDVICLIDGASLMRYWIGVTIVELLDDTLKPSFWTDPFTLSEQRAHDVDEAASRLANLQSEHLPHGNAVVNSIEDENNMTTSNTNAIDSSFEAAWKNGKFRCVEPHNVMVPQRRLKDARLAHSTSHDDPGPSKGYNTPSDDESLSDEVEMRTFHQRFGVGSRVCESMSSVSPSSSGSPTSSVLIGGIASPSSKPAL